MRIVFSLVTKTHYLPWYTYWQPQYIVVYKNYHCSLCTICRSIICIAHVVKFVLKSEMLPSETMGRRARLWKWLCCEERFSPHSIFPPVNLSATVLHWACTERVKAFRSEQSRHGWKATASSFSLWLRTRSMSNYALLTVGDSENWTILQTQEGSSVSRNGRDILPVFLLDTMSRHLP